MGIECSWCVDKEYRKYCGYWNEYLSVIGGCEGCRFDGVDNRVMVAEKKNIRCWKANIRKERRRGNG